MTSRKKTKGMGTAAAATLPGGVGLALNFGRPFIHPAFDYLLIGGGLSLLAAMGGWAFSGNSSADAALALPAMFLFSNYAHFAASTVRLYTKPGAFAALPFLTMVFPAITILVVSFGILFADSLGRYLNVLYLAWSPFHYSAQAYGLSVMYCYRSRCELTSGLKHVLWWACLPTFFHALIVNPVGSGGVWGVVPWDYARRQSWLVAGLNVFDMFLAVAAFLLPLGLFLWLQFRRRTPMPIISLLLLVTNAAWFFFFPYMKAIMLTTVFHGIQYLAIVTIFHVKDQTSQPGNRHGWLYHGGVFYGLCFVLGYGLFRCLPAAYNMVGFGYASSMLTVAAVINIHHFIVDAFIWKLRKDPNYRIVAEASELPSAA